MAKPQPTLFEVRKSLPFNGKEWRVTGYVDGKRKMHWFSTEKEAKADASDRNQERIAYGSQINLDASDRIAAFRALELIQPTGMDLLEFVRFGLSHWHQTKSSVSFSTLAEEFNREIARRLSSKEKMGSRQAQTLSVGVHKLAVRFGTSTVSDITANEVRDWSLNLPLSPRSKKNTVKIGRQVFSFAVERGYTAVNPFKAVKIFDENITVENGKVHILNADETARLLNAADPSVIPFLSLWFFAGIRRATLERLDWSDFQISDKRVIVPAASGKLQKRYAVTLSDNLLEWLRPHIKESGSILVTDRNGKSNAVSTRKLVVKAAKSSGVILPDNLGRHTFISMHVEHYENTAKTAKEANNSPKIIEQNYRHLVSKSDAAKYWDIKPGPAL